MGSYIYCLYSTEDGVPRYVGRAADKVSLQYRQHITAALEKQPGALYDWMHDVWRRGFDVLVFTLQQEIAPNDLGMFENYWVNQFSNLLNIKNGEGPIRNSSIGQQVIAALQQRLQLDVNKTSD